MVKKEQYQVVIEVEVMVKAVLKQMNEKKEQIEGAPEGEKDPFDLLANAASEGQACSSQQTEVPPLVELSEWTMVQEQSEVD